MLWSAIYSVKLKNVWICCMHSSVQLSVVRLTSIDVYCMILHVECCCVQFFCYRKAMGLLNWIILQTRGFFVGVISGHISVNALDGTYLGISLINLLGHLPMLGVTSAIDYLGMRALADPSSQREVTDLYIILFNKVVSSPYFLLIIREIILVSKWRALPSLPFSIQTKFPVIFFLSHFLLKSKRSTGNKFSGF